jgi:hypothetical protein
MKPHAWNDDTYIRAIGYLDGNRRADPLCSGDRYMIAYREGKADMEKGIIARGRHPSALPPKTR